MPIKLTKKSNKTQTHIKIASHASHQSGVQSQNPHGLIIDKMSITYSPPKSHLRDVHDALYVALAQADLFQSAQKKGAYKVNRNIALPSSAERVFFQAEPTTSGTAYARLEFNPSKIGPNGFADLHAPLQLVFPDGLYGVLKEGLVTRIDIAVDLPNVRMDDFILLPPSIVSMRAFSRNGVISTIYLGQSSGNQTKVYNKKKEQVAKGHKFNATIVRLERTSRNLKVAPSKLGYLKNPFGNICLVKNLPSKPAGEKQNLWSMFADSVAARGIVPALALLSVARRSRYRKHLKANALPWWQPEEIWAGWEALLQELTITTPEKYNF